MTPSQTSDVARVADAACEAFAASYCRLVVTAADGHWLAAARDAFCGYGTSVIGCDAEVGVERALEPNETPDARAGVAVLAFAFDPPRVAKAVANRVGQALLTCPTVAVFDGLAEAPERAALGDYLRYFGDGHQGRAGDAWVVPVMEGEVTLPATMGVAQGVAGGALLLCGRDPSEALAAARRAVEPLRESPGVITPFPGGVCRSGSKVGSRYARLVASTNEAYCPTLKDAVETQLPDGAECVYEIVINGVDETHVRAAMRRAIDAVLDGPLLALTASDYGGRLGAVRIPLRDLMHHRG